MTQRSRQQTSGANPIPGAGANLGRGGSPPPAPPFGRCLPMRLNCMFLARVRPIAAYRVEGEEDGAGKYPREEDNASSWGHGQDWSPGGGEARGTWPAGADRLSLRRAAV